MKTNIADFRSHIATLAESLDFQKEVAQIQAKALLRELTGQVPPYHWSYIARRVIRNLGIAKFELEYLARETPDEIDKLSYAARKFALVWEALAELREFT